MDYIRNEGNAEIVLSMIQVIHEQAAYLSEIDGATGDGDHGVNMDKGFQLAKERLTKDMSFSESLKVLGRTLVMDIGGSMGPIYGTFFSKLSRTLKDHQQIDSALVLSALQNALAGLMDLAGAKVGDKTLLDTLSPAIDAFQESMTNQENFYTCLTALKDGAQKGKEHTKQLSAKIGRAARLGERSKGFLDAGATSCCFLLCAMASTMQKQMMES